MNKYYAYELHCHTVNSDGSMTPSRLVDEAKARGYDGIAITDHNTDSGAEETARIGRERGLNVIKGIEWTTFYGHIVCLSDDCSVDWRVITKENVDEVVKNAYESGALLTIAHPKRIGAPVCIGCYMDFPITQFQYFSAFEVWSQKDETDGISNTLAIKTYDELLQKGYRLAAVYGYDWHSADKDNVCFANTFIGAEENTSESVKNAIRRGNTYVSIGLRLYITVDGKELPFGSTLSVGKHVFNVSVEYSDICDRGTVTAEQACWKGTAATESVSAMEEDTEIVLAKGYIRLELKGRLCYDKTKSVPVLFTSPYYVE